MENDFHIERWCGHGIRFVELKGEWYAVLKDICWRELLLTYPTPFQLGIDQEVIIRRVIFDGRTTKEITE